MAGFILCCWRDGHAGVTRAELEACAARFAPDNIRPHPSRFVVGPRLAVCVTNPTPAARLTESGVCLGRLLDGATPWDTCRSPAPDGSYAIARFDEGHIELLTDAVASRTVWYVKTRRLFCASTSQRALVMLLRDLQPNPAATAWLLTSGNLGPDAGWDVRIKRVPADARLRFDRAHWDVHVKTDEIGFQTPAASSSTGVEDLYEAITTTCRDMCLDDAGFVLPLSGGLDSRSILLGMLAGGFRPRCVTWGPAASLDDPKSDAVVATSLARALGLEHRFYPVEPAEPFAEVLDRFIALGEGAVEDIAHYVDGMRLYATLVESDVEGLVRGDEPSFGEYHVYRSEHQARIRENGLLVSDYSPAHALARLGLGGQVWPQALRRRPGEGLEAYSARVYEQHYVSAALAPLNHIKCAYLEIANPLLSRRVISAAHGLSSSLRRGRRSLKELDSRHGPAIPFASRHPSPVPRGFLALDPVVAEVRRALASEAAGALFSEQALHTLRGSLAPAEPRLKAVLRERAKEIVPKGLIELLHPVPSVDLSLRQLAFRACVAIRTHELLCGDADVLRTNTPRSSRQKALSP